MLKLIIENCRNISSVVEGGDGGLLLDEGKLNVLYGRNGVGKTTIARALRHAGGRADASAYDSLKSYEHLKSGDESLLPVARFSDGRQRECLVFDRAWVEDHYFKSDDSIADGAYRLCVDEGKLKNLRRNRDKLCAEVKAAAAAGSLPDAISEAEQMAKALGAGKSGFTGASKMASALKNGGTLAGLPAALDAVVPDEPELKGKWAAWHLVGGRFAPPGPPTCPYCGARGDQVADAVAFDQQHDPGQADAWLSAMKALEGETGHFDHDSVEMIRVALTTGTSDVHLAEQVGEFGGFLSSAVAAYRAVDGIAETPLEGPSAPTARVIENHVKALRAGACAFDPGVAPALLELADKAEQLGKTIENVKKIDDEWRNFLESEAKDYCEQMSQFLLAAGYPYRIDIKVDKKGEASLVLVHRQTGRPVKGVETPLSYGERNALSLALFYSEAIKNGDALIVLDDPISSFDGVKRFALLSALFSRRGSKLLGSSLNGRFVVMLTHDPLVVHDSLRFLASRCATTAKYLFTGADGVMAAREVGAGDFQPCVRLIESRIASYARQSDDPLPFCALAYMRQRFELSRRLTSSDLYDLAERGRAIDEDLEREASDALAFALLSSLVHGDPTPTLRRSGDGNGGLDMPKGFVSAAEDTVNALLVRCGSGARFDFARYSALMTEKPPSYITDCYAAEGTSPYEKLLLLRALLDLDGSGSAYMDPYHEYVLDSAFHLGGDLVMQLDRDGFCQVPPHIQGVCDDAFKAYMKKAGNAGSEAVCS